MPHKPTLIHSFGLSLPEGLKIFHGMAGVLEMEMKLTEMNASDEITIRTQFSDYRFRLIEPLQGRGVLRGGIFGMEQHEAILVETIPPTDNAKPLFDQLGPGDRAVFIVGSNTLKKLITSTITEIVVSEQKLTPEQSAQLITAANHIKTDLGCP